MTHMSNSKASYSRLDRIYNSQSLYQFAWVHHSTNRSTDVQPLPFQTDHYPVSISLIDPASYDVQQYKTWKLNTHEFMKPNNIDKVRSILNDKLAQSDRVNIFDKYEEFKLESIKHMRSIQRKESKAWKEKHEEICRILEPNSGYLDCEIERAKRTLLDMEDHELAGKFIRSKAKDISQKSQMTKHHFAKAKKDHETTIMTHMLDPSDNIIKYSQVEIENILVQYWEHIMRKRDTNTIPSIVTSAQQVFQSVTKTLPHTSQIELGMGSDPSNFIGNSTDNLVEFISKESIYESIKTSKLNKSPGIDGLPIEFYDALAESPDSPIIEFLQKVYIASYVEGILPPSMRQSQIRLLYKKESIVDKKFPKNYRPIALLSVDYKILSKLLAKKLKSHLPFIIESII